MTRGRKPGRKNDLPRSPQLQSQASLVVSPAASTVGGDEIVEDKHYELGGVETEVNGSAFDPQFQSNPGMNKIELTSSEIGEEKKKKKIAPRSSEQFKIGPRFEGTQIHQSVYVTSTNEVVEPVIDARVDRGFDFIDNEWIGYKRNYFSLVAAFNLREKPQTIFFNDRFHILDVNNKKLNVKCFALRLESQCCEEDVKVNLVQHTAKRDRGPQYKPQVFPAIPGTLPDHNSIKKSSNIRNDSKIDQFNRLFYLHGDYETNASQGSIIHTYPKTKISTVARYERMQFTTSINYRKPALVNRHFILRVELLGILDDGIYTVLASNSTPPLIVRGRSPSNYQLAKLNAKRELQSINQIVHGEMANYYSSSPFQSYEPTPSAKNNASILQSVDTNLNLTHTAPYIYQDRTNSPLSPIQPEGAFNLNSLQANYATAANPNASTNASSASASIPRNAFSYYTIESQDLDSPEMKTDFNRIEEERGYLGNNLLLTTGERYDQENERKSNSSSSGGNGNKHGKHKHKTKHKHKHKSKKHGHSSRSSHDRPTSFNAFKCELERLQMEL